MEELIKQQEELIAGIQKKLGGRVGREVGAQDYSEALSRAVHDLDTLKRLAASTVA